MNPYGGPAPGSAADKQAAIIVAVLGTLFALVMFLGIRAVICHFLSKSLKRIPPENRHMEPGQVWLLLIPCFEIYWNFKVFNDMPTALRVSFDRIGIGQDRVGDCGAKLCDWYPKLYVAGIFAAIIPFIGSAVMMGSLIVLILALVRINDLSRMLADHQLDAGDGDDHD